MGYRILLLLSLTIALFGKQNVAVYDLKGYKISNDQMALFSDRIRTELTVTKAYNVMERSEMDAILKEMTFQQSGMCDETSCLVEVGKMLTVDRVISGSIGLVSINFYSITLRVINVQTGEIVVASASDYEGDAKGLISTGIRDAVRKLAIASGLTIATNDGSGKYADLYISADKDSAIIEIDGVVMHQKTPALFSNIESGNHQIIVRRGNLFGKVNITLRPNDLLKKHIELHPGKGDLAIYSEPTGATIHIDGKVLGSTPEKITQLEAGYHRVTLTHEGFQTYDSSIAINSNSVVKLVATLSKIGWVRINASVPGAILVDGFPKKTDHYNRVLLTPGKKVISYETDLYFLWSDTVLVEPGKETQFTPLLLKRYGALTIEATPQQTNLSISASNGKVFSNKLPYRNNHEVPGTTHIKLFAENYDTFDTTITVEAGKEIQLNKQLRYSLAYLSVQNKTDSTPASIYLNDREIGKTPWQGSIEPGDVVLKIVKDSTCTPIVHLLTVHKGDSLKFLETFEKSPEWFTHEKKRKQNIRRIVCGAGSVLCGVGAIIANQHYANAQSVYENETSEDAAIHESNYTNLSTKQQNRTFWFAGTALFSVGLAISIPF